MKEEKKKDYTIEELKTLHKKMFTDETLSQLIDGFQNDFTNEEASRHAGISPASYYRYYEMSSELREKVDHAKAFMFTLAKKTWRNAIKDDNVPASIEFLKRRQKKLYSERQEHTGPDGGAIENNITLTDFQKMSAEDKQKALTDQIKEHE